MRIDKDNIKIVLILLVVALGIGYSYLNTELNINGTANINSANWSVYWNNVQVKNGSVEATTPTIDTNKTTVTFNVTLTKPGDYYEFSVDAVNAGTLDAMIDTISSKLNGTTITTLPAYLDYDVTYSDGTPLEANQELLHDTTETYKVRLSYKDNISASDLPDTNQSLSLQFSVTYKQADEEAEEVPHPAYTYTVNLTNTGDGYVQTGEAMPNDITQYSSAADALAALKLAVRDNDIQFYLKHMTNEGVVTESYVEFVITQDMAQANSGVTAGTYALRGFNTYDGNASSTNNCKSEYYDTSSGMCRSPYYESNKDILQNAFGNERCAEYTNGNLYEYYSCHISGLEARADHNGFVEALEPLDSWYCRVGRNGSSYCEGGD